MEQSSSFIPKSFNYKKAFFIVLTLLVLETALIVYAWNLGSTLNKQEIMCANDICYDKNATAFLVIENVCTCYNENKVVHKEVLK